MILPYISAEMIQHNKTTNVGVLVPTQAILPQLPPSQWKVVGGCA
jgi:hypothetical protein